MCQGQKENSKCDKGKNPKDCSPEKVKECHPEGGHPCEKKPDEKKAEQ